MTGPTMICKIDAEDDDGKVVVNKAKKVQNVVVIMIKLITFLSLGVLFDYRIVSWPVYYADVRFTYLNITL